MSSTYDETLIDSLLYNSKTRKGWVQEFADTSTLKDSNSLENLTTENVAIFFLIIF